jgi:hypothetical protein
VLRAYRKSKESLFYLRVNISENVWLPLPQAYSRYVYLVARFPARIRTLESSSKTRELNYAIVLVTAALYDLLKKMVGRS